MLHSVRLVVRPEYTLHSVDCQNDHRRWSPPEAAPSHGLMLVRRGRFRLAAEGVVVDLDQSMAYLTAAGEENRFAHPAGGDRCTWITLSAGGWQCLVGDYPAGTAIYVDAQLELTHRRLLVAVEIGDVDYGVTEQLLRLLGRAASQQPQRIGPGSYRVSVEDAALVDAARGAIVTDHPAAGRLISLARYLEVSPTRLSRAFSRQLGVSITRYRNRLRVGRAVSQLADGRTDLAVLAADLGFADQAHLCRTIRSHLGHTPTGVRELLCGSPVTGRWT